MIKIDIISDTVCPWCFIGKNRLDKAIKNFKNIDFNLTWHPFQLNPDMPKEGMDRKLYLASKFGGEQRANEVYNQISRAGKSSGINFEFEKIKIMPNSLSTHSLIEYAKEFNLQNDLVTDLFNAFFIDGENIGEKNILKNIANKHNLNLFNIKNDTKLKEIETRVINSDYLSRSKGISGVPFFIINEEYAVSGAQENEVFEKIFETCLIKR